jgi:hypothetical protein
MAMRSRSCGVAVGLALMALSALASAQKVTEAASPPQARDRTEQQVRNGSASQARNGDIYGYQLMTERERTEFRERVRAARTEQEREQIRSAHHAQMQARAKDRGVTLSGPRITGGSGMAANAGDDGGSGQ